MKTITIDGCSICQLKCVQCPVTQMGYKNTIGKGYLQWRDFQRLLMTNPRAKHVEFDNFGEFFLNKDLLLIFSIAQRDKIMLSCAGGVNLNNVQPEILEALVRTRFQYLNVSIDGASQETYEQYRVGGNFEEVIKNVKLINEYKKKYNSKYPKLQWQFIVFGHNELELPRAKKMAEELGMRFYPKMNWNSEYSPINNVDFVKQETGWEITTREEYQKKYGISYVRPTCYSLWNSPRYSWDLTKTGCCWNIWSRFDSYDLDYAKYMLKGKAPSRLHVPCTECEIYHDLARTDKFLTTKEIFVHIHKFRFATLLKYHKWRHNL